MKRLFVFAATLVPFLFSNANSQELNIMEIKIGTQFSDAKKIIESKTVKPRQDYAYYVENGKDKHLAGIKFIAKSDTGQIDTFDLVVDQVNNGEIIGIRRNVEFLKNPYPSKKTIESSLVEKYGKPTRSTVDQDNLSVDHSGYYWEIAPNLSESCYRDLFWMKSAFQTLAHANGYRDPGLDNALINHEKSSFDKYLFCSIKSVREEVRSFDCILENVKRTTASLKYVKKLRDDEKRKNEKTFDKGQIKL